MRQGSHSVVTMGVADSLGPVLLPGEGGVGGGGELSDVWT